MARGGDRPARRRWEIDAYVAIAAADQCATAQQIWAHNYGPIREREKKKKKQHPLPPPPPLTPISSDRSGRLGMSGRKETVLDLAKFVDKGVQVKLTGGRQVTGTLKGYDQLLNLVLDEAVEFEREQDDPLKLSGKTRQLGLIVCRGTAVMLVSPTDGTDEIANPFQADGA
ncbi:hypothetical protein GUJ93_ZPchr0010g9522 [Zizania palustris]|uniref:Sm domain-containing protein n=2 Tax=Oryzeae TaxID=147380 RepID=A0A8J5WB89_ZIZPA|nr:hypothetical protein GUJ93_ZPchr0010g9522 [Zizania palustris]